MTTSPAASMLRRATREFGTEVYPPAHHAGTLTTAITRYGSREVKAPRVGRFLNLRHWHKQPLAQVSTGGKLRDRSRRDGEANDRNRIKNKQNQMERLIVGHFFVLIMNI